MGFGAPHATRGRKAVRGGMAELLAIVALTYPITAPRRHHPNPQRAHMRDVEDVGLVFGDSDFDDGHRNTVS